MHFSNTGLSTILLIDLLLLQRACGGQASHRRHFGNSLEDTPDWFKAVPGESKDVAVRDFDKFGYYSTFATEKLKAAEELPDKASGLYGTGWEDTFQ